MNNDQKNNIEVEIRALINNLDKIGQNVLKNKGQYLGHYYIHDIYFCKQEITKLEEVEMNEIGSYGLRIRKIKRDNKTTITINTKTIIKKNDHNAWEEHEVEVNNFKEIFYILESTEFKAFFELKKTRHHYQLDGFEIFLEDITDFTPGVEIEKMTNIGNKEQVKEEMILFAKKIGIDKNSILPKSITNLIMKERAFKRPIKL